MPSSRRAASDIKQLSCSTSSRLCSRSASRPARCPAAPQAASGGLGASGGHQRNPAASRQSGLDQAEHTAAKSSILSHGLLRTCQPGLSDAPCSRAWLVFRCATREHRDSELLTRPIFAPTACTRPARCRRYGASRRRGGRASAPSGTLRGAGGEPPKERCEFVHGLKPSPAHGWLRQPQASQQSIRRLRISLGQRRQIELG